MGGVGYAAQSTLYFTALERLDASLVALIFYVYPVLVMTAAILVRRERASARRFAALGVALTGIVLALAGTSTGQFDTAGALLALGSAVGYTGYIIIGDRVTEQIPALPLAALVCSGAFLSFLVAGTVRGGVDLAFEPRAWLWLLAIALVSTVGAILLFFAGLARVGPSTAALLSIFEPVVTVVAAGAVVGEALTRTQWTGGAMVLAAVLIVQLPSRPAGNSGVHLEPRAGVAVSRDPLAVGCEGD
jgi:drug/metabolite transporter (DMT)-like permease